MRKILPDKRRVLVLVFLRLVRYQGTYPCGAGGFMSEHTGAIRKNPNFISLRA